MPENLYRRGGVWWGKIQVARRVYRRSLRTSDRAEARRRLDLWRKETVRAAAFGDNRLSWKDAVVRYTTSVMPGAVKPATAARYRVSFRQVDAFLSGLHVDQITRQTLADMVSARAKEGATNATINRDLTAVSQVISAAMEWGAAEHNAARDFNRRLLTRERRDPISPPTDDDVAAVIAKAPGRFAALIRFLRLEGCRQEEGASLEWPHVDLNAGTVHFARTKTSRPRTITIKPETVELLRSLPRHLRTRTVFWHGQGARYLNVASRFRQIADDAGKSFRCHDLRHAYAIAELRAGRDIYDLSRHLGHSSVKTTEGYLGYVPGGQPVARAHQRAQGDAS
ncbi:MAG: tyrosine-type recombinase/integrase [Alphaproteobacteria bacterium]